MLTQQDYVKKTTVRLPCETRSKARELESDAMGVGPTDDPSPPDPTVVTHPSLHTSTEALKLLPLS